MTLSKATAEAVLCTSPHGFALLDALAQANLSPEQLTVEAAEHLLRARSSDSPRTPTCDRSQVS